MRARPPSRFASRSGSPGTPVRPVDRALQLSVIDGVLHALMLGVSESYFGACAVALGHTDLALALLMSLPLFAGALAQAFTGPLVLALGSRKRLVVFGAVLQALSHVGLIYVAWTGVTSLGPLLLLVVLYFVSGMAIVPAWGAWMGALTEHIDRERYFGVRSAFISVALLCSLLLGGYHLHESAASGQVSQAYALLFAVGLLARAASSAMLFLQPDPCRPPRDSLRRVLARTRTSVRSEHMQLGLGLALVMFGTHASVPFYAPYMLKTLHLSYGGFALLCAVQIATKSLVFPVLHHVSALISLPRLLLSSVAMAAAVAWLWGASMNMHVLVFAQVLSGVAWASYDFASFQLLLRGSKPSHRVEFLAMAASLGGLFQISGALFGSFLLTHVQLAYRELFLVSAGLRALPLFMLAPLLLQSPLKAGRRAAGSRVG